MFAAFSRLVFEWRTSPARERSFSRDAFGRMVGLSGDTVRRWESGKQRPSPANCEEVARVLNVPATTVLAAAGYVVPGRSTTAPETHPGAQHERLPAVGDTATLDRLPHTRQPLLPGAAWEPMPILGMLSLAAEGAMERRSFLALTGGSLAGPILPWMLEPAPLLGHEGTFRVGISDVDRIDSLVDGLRRASDTRTGPAMLTTIRGLLDYVADHLKNGTYREDVEQRLYGAAAQLARLLGWLTFELGDKDAAIHWCLLSLRAAHLSRNRTLGPYALGVIGSIEVFSGGNPHEVVTIVEAARSGSAGALTPKGHADLHGVEAQAHGAARDVRRAALATDAAFAALERSRPEDEPPWWYFVDEQDICGTVGEAFRSAEDYPQARYYLTRGAALGVTQPRDRVIYDVRLASTLLADNEVEQACGVADHAITIAERLRVPRLTASISGFADELQRFRGYPGVDAIVERAGELRRTVPVPASGDE